MKGRGQAGGKAGGRWGEDGDEGDEEGGKGKGRDAAVAPSEVASSALEARMQSQPRLCSTLPCATEPLLVKNEGTHPGCPHLGPPCPWQEGSSPLAPCHQAPRRGRRQEQFAAPQNDLAGEEGWCLHPDNHHRHLCHPLPPGAPRWDWGEEVFARQDPPLATSTRLSSPAPAGCEISGIKITLF